MSTDRQRAAADFRRRIKFIFFIAVVTVIAPVTAVSFSGHLDTGMIRPLVLAVLFAALLGCGLVAAVFVRDRRGHDQA